MPRHAHRPPTQRALRVGEELRHALARIFERGELHDPELADVAVTVTQVQVAPDLKNATVYVMPLAGVHEAEVMAALRRSAPFLRHAVASAVQLRYAPNLVFALDTSFDHASQIRALLGRPEVARDLAPREDDTAPDEDADKDGA